MTKLDLIKRLAAAHPHLCTRDIQRIVDTVFGQIGSALAQALVSSCAAQVRSPPARVTSGSGATRAPARK